MRTAVKKNGIASVAGIALACCLCLVTGCASIPLHGGASYWKDLYRRIPYKIDGSYRVIDIFYATDRAAKTDSEEKLSFTRRLAPEMTYGTLNVKVNPRIKIEKMIPKRLQRNGDIGIQEVRRLGEEEFFKKVSEAVAASPHNSLLVVVFGYKDDFEATAIKAAYFSYLLDINTPILLFDWPGDQDVSIGGYKQAREMATASGPYLGRLLAKVIRTTSAKNLWVEASSLGSQVVCDAFDYMYQHEDLADPEAEIAHVVLAAPDVGRDDFREHFKDKLASLSRRLTTYVSSDDNALLISGIINGQQRLGRVRIKDPEQLDEMKDLLYLKSQHPDKIAVIDVTPINNASYKHGYYLESPEFYDDFYLRIFDKDPNVNRHLYLLKAQDSVDYWVLRGDK